MSKRHDAVIDDVLGGLDQGSERAADPGGSQAGSRFLRRSTAIGERLSGGREEKTLFWVDPDECRMWAGHNRAYGLLTAENCRDLIDGIRAQGRQEFPAIARRIADGVEDAGEDGGRVAYEVVCGARRHFAIAWLRANNYPQFRYLVELRDLTDEEAFRLADIENRDRADISDYERAVDYARAVAAYYGGRQRKMAARLEVSEAWLSRYLALAALPAEVVAAYGSIRDIRESHARALKPLLADPGSRAKVLSAAADLARGRAGQVQAPDGPAVIAALKAAARPRPAPAAAPKKNAGHLYRRGPGERGLLARRRGAEVVLEFPDGLTRGALQAAFGHFLAAYEAAGDRFPEE